MTFEDDFTTKYRGLQALHGRIAVRNIDSSALLAYMSRNRQTIFCAFEALLERAARADTLAVTPPEPREYSNKQS